MKYTFRELASLWQLQLNQQFQDQVISEIVYDTRRVGLASSTLFVALKGAHRDGHNYIQEAYRQGIRAFLIQQNRTSEFEHLSDAVFFSVDDPLTALQDWAIFHRSKWRIPVIGITGSNGKTVVKEWLFELLKGDFEVYKSPRSFNSQLGVALSILGMDETHQLAIIEAGISGKGDMQKLHEMIKPNLVVLTHLGDAHDEGFENRASKAFEKSLLIEGADVVVYPKDQKDWSNPLKYWKQKQPLTKFITWGYDDTSSYVIEDIKKTHRDASIHFRYRSMSHNLQIPFIDQASISNALSCFSTLTALERWDEEHLNLFKELHAIENRLSIEKGKRQNIIINDSYSHDFESLQIALSVLNEQSAGMPHWVILSPIWNRKLGVDRLCQILKQYDVQKVIWVGNTVHGTFEGLEQIFFETTEELLKSPVLSEIAAKALLIKGARIHRLERVVEVLKQQLHHTVMEIDLDAILHNYRFFKNKIPSKTKMMVMAKAAGYGSGQYEVAKLLESQGVDYLGVAYADEGISLRNSGVKIPIMVMNADGKGHQQCVDYGLEPVIYSQEGLMDVLSRSGKEPMAIHIEMDTGMHRLGFPPETDWSFLKLHQDRINVKSVFTHLSASENAEMDSFTHEQYNNFIESFERLKNEVQVEVGAHILNTSGMLRFPEYSLDMVRLGIGLYGQESPCDEFLKPAVSLNTTITQKHLVGAGMGIGYGQLDAANHERTIATIAIGYADGLLRKYGRGNWSVWLNGTKVPIVGNICMDMAMIDVTGVACEPGDRVEIFGTHLSITEMARRGETISYEILTSISQRVPRIFVGEY